MRGDGNRDSATPTSLQPGEWTTLECDSTEDYRYLYMMRPDNTAWYGYAAEIQFWGWDEADIDQDGIVIFVR